MTTSTIRHRVDAAVATPNGKAAAGDALANPAAQIITATFQGKDSALAINRILHAVSAPDLRLVDLRHIVVRNRVTIVIQVCVPALSPHEGALYKSLLSVASSLKLSVDFDFAPETPAPAKTDASDSDAEPREDADDHDDDKHDVRSDPGSDAGEPALSAPASRDAFHAADDHSASNYVLTLLSPAPISPQFLSTLASRLSDHALTAAAVTQLSSSALRCLELALSASRTLTPRDVAAVRSMLFSLGRTAAVDVALQAESVTRRSKRLVVFDMDSTLIQQEVIDELARYAGVFEEVRDITHRAMTGGLDFRQSLAERVALLAGADAQIFDRVIANLVYTPGAKTLCRTLKRLGYKLAVISGGFTRVTAHVRHELGLDYDYANMLEEVDGKFTGRTIGPVVSAQRKADLLTTIAQLERITLDQVIAIGDGANDLPMLGTAGLGIAFNAKPAVQEAASFRINQTSLKNVLYLLGFSEQDQDELSGGASDKQQDSKQNAV